MYINQIKYLQLRLFHRKSRRLNFEHPQDKKKEKKLANCYLTMDATV